MAQRRTFRDRLTTPAARIPAPAGPPPAPPHAIGFDETTIQFFPPVAEGPFFRYGPMNILQVPAGIGKAIVKGLTVNGNPIGTFDSRCWWTLRLETGGLQEFLGKDSILGPTGPVVFTQEALTAGIRHTHFGSMQIPEPEQIELPQSALLQLVVLSELSLTGLSVYTRVFGEYYSRAVEGA